MSELCFGLIVEERKKIMTPILPKNSLDLTGHKYGKLTVIKFAGQKKGANTWLCHCECGSTYTYYGSNLRGGYSKQCVDCGLECLWKSRITHGKSKTRIYIIWNHHQENKTLCKEWMNFRTFYEDIGDPPGEDRYFCRYNRKEPYSPKNYYWGATKQNKMGRLFTYKDTTLNMSEWGEQLGISRERVRQLIYKFGSIENILEYRANKRGVSIEEVFDNFSE